MDKVREYLQKRNCAQHVISGGEDDLLTSWKEIVSGLTRQSSSDIIYEEYLNDLDTRQILEEILPLLSLEKMASFREQLLVTDRQFFDSTISTEKCIWGEENAKNNNWSTENNWWYYRLPKEPA